MVTAPRPREQRFQGLLHLTQQDMYLFFFRPLLFRLGPAAVVSLMQEYMRVTLRYQVCLPVLSIICRSYSKL